MTEKKGVLLKNEPLAKYTSWRVGGPAEKMYLPEGREDLIAFLTVLPEQEEIYWLGLGSNLLVRDGGIHGTVINTRGRLKVMQLVDTNKVYVEAGVPCAHAARFCTELGLTGAEFLAGIPGTMGGALKMNAGAFGGETWNIVDTVEMINANGRVTKRAAEEFEVAYRAVSGLGGEWFLAVELKLSKGESELSQQKIKSLLERRALTQPTNKPTCGSVFKNPPGDYAARLIEACGLKGYAIGGACVSKKHANFIENTGNATAADIEGLIAYIQQQVDQNHSVKLQTEVCRVGDSL
ncbi:MAG: UDP-N-acetylmuramate dehydrogenase [Methylococcales bacterium]|nr:UDP-N-acetylmuramate dehydrogenase [Methylococcales bacterium]